MVGICGDGENKSEKVVAIPHRRPLFFLQEFLEALSDDDNREVGGCRDVLRNLSFIPACCNLIEDDVASTEAECEVHCTHPGFPICIRVLTDLTFFFANLEHLLICEANLPI